MFLPFLSVYFFRCMLHHFFLWVHLAAVLYTVHAPLAQPGPKGQGRCNFVDTPTARRHHDAHQGLPACCLDLVPRFEAFLSSHLDNYGVECISRSPPCRCVFPPLDPPLVQQVLGGRHLLFIGDCTVSSYFTVLRCLLRCTQAPLWSNRSAWHVSHTRIHTLGPLDWYRQGCECRNRVRVAGEALYDALPGIPIDLSVKALRLGDGSRIVHVEHPFPNLLWNHTIEGYFRAMGQGLRDLGLHFDVPPPLPGTHTPSPDPKPAPFSDSGPEPAPGTDRGRGAAPHNAGRRAVLVFNYGLHLLHLLPDPLIRPNSWMPSRSSDSYFRGHMSRYLNATSQMFPGALSVWKLSSHIDDRNWTGAWKAWQVRWQQEKVQTLHKCQRYPPGFSFEYCVYGRSGTAGSHLLHVKELRALRRLPHIRLLDDWTLTVNTTLPTDDGIHYNLQYPRLRMLLVLLLLERHPGAGTAIRKRLRQALPLRKSDLAQQPAN